MIVELGINFGKLYQDLELEYVAEIIITVLKLVEDLMILFTGLNILTDPLGDGSYEVLIVQLFFHL